MPQTIQASYNQFQSDVRSKNTINSISPDNVADLGDTCVLLSLERGLYIIPNTSNFETLPGTEARIALVENAGIFKWASTGPPANGSTIFDAPGGSKWIRVLQTNQAAGSISLDDLLDVDLSGAQPGDSLVRNGSGIWENSPFPEGGVASTPQIMSGAVLTPTKIRLTFRTQMQYTNANGLSINDGTNNPIISIFGTGTNTIDLVLQNEIGTTDSVTFSYDSALGDLRDLGGNEIVNIVDFVVQNMLEGDSPSSPGGKLFVLNADGTIPLNSVETLVGLLVYSANPMTNFKVGTTDGGDDIIGTQNTPAMTDYISFPQLYKSLTNKTLYVKGVNGTLQIVKVLA
jgi:hypothetical protein